MFNQVARRLVFQASVASSTEYSRAVEMNHDNSAMFEVWLKSKSSSGTIGTVTVVLQGSNDLSNWRTAGSGTTTTLQVTTPTFPSHHRREPDLTVEWRFLRLQYTVAKTTDAKMMIGAAITTYEKQ